MNNPKLPENDSATLSVAVAAGAVAIFVAPGPYQWSDLIVGITLLTIIISYELRNERTLIQNIAVAMVLSFISLLIVGFILELYYGNGSLNGKFDKNIQNFDSAVPDYIIAIEWLVMTIFFWIIEKFYKKKI